MIEILTQETVAKTQTRFERCLTFYKLDYGERGKVGRWGFDLSLVDSVEKKEEQGRLTLKGVLIEDRWVVYEGGDFHVGNGEFISYMQDLCLAYLKLYKEEDLETALKEAHQRMLDYANRKASSKFGCVSLQNHRFPFFDKTPYSRNK